MNDLDLTNPDTIAKLKEMDVMARKENDIEKEEIDAAIASLDIPNDFVVKLSKLQVQQLQREAGQLGLSVDTHLNNRIQAELFAKNVGAPLISQPSNLSGFNTKKRITGPSFMKTPND
jgi:hypothetical protein